MGDPLATDRHHCNRCRMTFVKVDSRDDIHDGANRQRVGCPECRLFFWYADRGRNTPTHCSVLRADVEPA